ncbi:MAG: hypothetical protein FGM14_15935 [Flavobacteriales bacterium]|nr:hypothetical protein [Flavobacteriales bacterium]
MKSFNKYLLFFASVLTSYMIVAQDSLEVEEEYNEEPITFSGTRIINGHSVGTLTKGTFDMRIEHRFGDIAGTNGGYQNMFGFDNLSDMRIALEYGITDDLMVGFGRSKGAKNSPNSISPYSSLLDGFVKYKILEQKKGEMPLSLSVIAGSTFTYMKASTDESQVNYFPKDAHRFAYFTQINAAKHFGDRFSIALMPTYVYRNYVVADDQNGLFALGGAFRLRLTQRFALLTEYYHTFSSNDLRQNGYRNSLGVALEWFTFGHNFTINFTNSTGLGETQFIPYTAENWLKGQFRFGFCVGRKFTIE